MNRPFPNATCTEIQIMSFFKNTKNVKLLILHGNPMDQVRDAGSGSAEWSKHSAIIRRKAAGKGIPLEDPSPQQATKHTSRAAPTTGL